VAHDAAGEPKPKAQRNFTDPDSRIMKQGSDFQQAYNAQNVVDSTHQIIIAADVTNQAPDVEHLPPMIDKAIENVGAKPDVLSADAGYWSAENDEYVEGQGLDAYIAIRRQKHNEASAASAVVTAPTEVVPPETTLPEAAQSGTEAIAPTGLEDGGGSAPVPKGADEANVNVRAASTPLERKERMRAKLGTEHGKALYARRKAIVEPPFGHIKANRGFRQFLLRGIEQVRGEWVLACMCHNLLKLFVAGPEAKLLGMATR
jgi:hypothetical protein